jgi:hypothetical protein
MPYVRDEPRAKVKNEVKDRLTTKSAFTRYIGIDYSRAETPAYSLKGLRLYLADREKVLFEVPPPHAEYR